MVTIIVPTYNRSHCLARALESVIQQSSGDWECVVVDDGSTDDTLELVEKRASRDPRIRYFRQENKGAAAARNAGVRLATRKWVAFLDSDDELLPWAVECYQHGAAAFPDVNVLVGQTEFGRRRAKAPRLCALTVQRADYLFGGAEGPGHFFIHSVAVRRTALPEVGGFDETLLTGEDTDFLLRLRAMTNVAAIPWPVALVHRSDEGKYAQNIATGQRLEAELYMFRKLPQAAVIRERVRNDPARLAEVRAFCARRTEMLEIVRLLRQEQYEEAADGFARYWAGSPPLEETKLHFARWFDHLYYPKGQPAEATQRFAPRVALLARAVRHRGHRDASAFLTRGLLASMFHEGWRQLQESQGRKGWRVLLAGLRYGPGPTQTVALAVNRIRQ